MRKVILIVLAVAALSSCGMTQSLYNWGFNLSDASDYENAAYNVYNAQTPESICRLLCEYEKLVSHPGGSREVPPPGICAEYGYLLLKPETAEIFASKATASQKRLFEGSDYAVIFASRGEEMLKKELELYPESAKLIQPILDRIGR